MSKINTCDYCSTSISDEMENYAGKNEDYCCKRCDDAADNAYYSRPLIN